MRGGIVLGDLKASETIIGILEYFVCGVYVLCVSLSSLSRFDSLERSMDEVEPGDFVGLAA